MEKMDRLSSFGQWELVKLLGQGAFGQVHLWRNHITGQEIATKRLKANLKLKQDEINILHKRWLQEYNWMQNLKTRYIVSAIHINDHEFLNYLAQQNHTEHPLPVIIMDYCNGGDLRSQLNKKININGLLEYDVQIILHAITSAIKHLHEVCNIEHRDIKPENIVLHVQGYEKIYKLADFGYAREIPESTISQSVVGTRNYVAPEVIDPGTYTKTVDYWSIGIVAYEIICGIQPFIPHQTIVNRMECIQQKPRQCIAIVQSIDDPTAENFKFINHILPQNHSSPIFINSIENWLRLALDNNYKTRGCNNNNELKFFSDLETLLMKKVVTVFSLKTYQIYYYDIELYNNVIEFMKTICFDNQIDFDNVFFVYPLLHPKKNSQNPVDYFVPEWRDTSDPHNPKVMLFIVEFLIPPDFYVDVNKHFNISETLKKCMSMGREDENIPLWLLETFEREVHYILASQQTHMECYLMGLKHYLMDIESNVFQYKVEVDILNKKTSELNGCVKHSDVVMSELMNAQNRQFQNAAIQTTNVFTSKIHDLQRNYDILVATYNEILRKCKKLANEEILEQYPKNDIFGLLAYRKFLSKDYSSAERLEYAQNAFEKCTRQFIEFTRSTELYNIRAEINLQIQKFNLLRQNVVCMQNEILQIENALNDFTRFLIRQTINDTTLSLSMNSLHIDGTMPISLLNKDNGSFDNETPALINDFESILNAMETTMNTE